MIRGLSRIVPNVVVGVWLAMGFLIAQPVSAEEKAKATAPADSTAQSSSVSAPLVKGTLAEQMTRLRQCGAARPRRRFPCRLKSIGRPVIWKRRSKI